MACRCICLTSLVILPFTAAPLHAGNAPTPRIVHAIDRYPYVLWRETWAGAELQADSWSVYSGTTIALSGDIEGPGWRLRTTGGYGQYTYRKAVGTAQAQGFAKFTGRTTFSDVLLGYHAQWKGVTLKAFAGITAENQQPDARDPAGVNAGFSYGGKVALEAWTALTKHHWAAADIAYASNLNSYQLGLRTGYRLLDTLDIGLEGRIEDKPENQTGRVAAFMTMQFGDAGLTAAAGISGGPDTRTSHYFSASLFYRY